MNTLIHSFGTRVATAILALSAMTPAPAAAAEAGTPPALQKIMRQLGEDMQQVTHAIAMEDWPRVVQLAPGIARHEQPPAGEKVRILSWLGSDAAQFRGFDGIVHEAATALGEAAGREDGEAVISSFAQLQRGCLGCHQRFRAAFIVRFHEEP